MNEDNRTEPSRGRGVSPSGSKLAGERGEFHQEMRTGKPAQTINRGDQTGLTAPAELFSRARREKEFFDSYSDPGEIPDAVLVVPTSPELLDLPSEMAELVPWLKGKTVCDYGCGYGLTSAYFALQGAVTYAFDVSETNIAVARRAACVNGVGDRVHLQVAQGEFLSFPDNFFDLVFGKGVLHHLDLAHAAREMYRVLKPGGAAIMFDPLGENRLLEWARNCPLRSSKHRHTADERSLLYKDIEELRSVFPDLTFRETGLFTVIKVLFRKVEAGMVAIPRWESTLRLLARVDAWLMRRLPMVRPLAQYVVISMVKPAERGHSTARLPGRTAVRGNPSAIRSGEESHG